MLFHIIFYLEIPQHKTMNWKNLSLKTATFPEAFKTAFVRPSLKKTSLDTNELLNYRTISNLPFLSKILEKIVLTQ